MVRVHANPQRITMEGEPRRKAAKNLVIAIMHASSGGVMWPRAVSYFGLLELYKISGQ